MRSTSTKKAVFAYLVLSFLVGTWCTTAQAADFPNGGDGTVGTPWIIRNAADLIHLAGEPAHWGQYFRQDRDIIWFGNAPIAPIGDVANGPFTGGYDGGECRIIGLAVVGGFAGPGGDGLFGIVQSTGLGSGVITRVVLEFPFILGTSADVGALVGTLQSGALTQCAVRGGFVIGSVFIEASAGGLVGNVWAPGVITECYSTAAVTGRYHVGGLVGTNAGAITNCYARANTVTQIPLWPVPPAAVDLGGLVGWNNAGAINSCYADTTAIVPLTVGQGTNVLSIGGLVGRWVLPASPIVFWPFNYSNQTTPGVPGVPVPHAVSNGIGAPIKVAWAETIAASHSLAELMAQVTFAGWDFNFTWYIVEGADTPKLRNVP